MNRLEFFDRLPTMTLQERMLVQWAYALAKKWHYGQARDTGERYFEHVRRVANILIDHGYGDADHLILAILHDGLEDTTIPLSMLDRLFGARIANEILAVSKTYGVEDPLTGFVTHSRKRTRREYFAGIVNAGRRTIIVKCADRIDNLTDLVDPPAGTRWTPKKRMSKVRETREWILPLAEAHEPRFAARLRELCDAIEANAKRARAQKKTQSR